MNKTAEKYAFVIIHISFLFMIAGGVCTALFASSGMLHLYPSQSSASYILDDSRVMPLPERVTLLSFDTDLYPGTSMPKDFRSVLLTASGDTVTVSTHHVGHLPGGYRLYQTSYDEHGGTWLTVARDLFGRTLVFIGFLLFALGAVACFASRIRRRSPVASYALMVLALSLGACAIFMHPSREGLIPALATWWLPVHVAFAAAGYIVLASTFPLAVAAMALNAKRCRLLSVAKALTAPGVFLMGLGIMTGSLWADVAWGRYWGWDPKEMWALITFIIYSVTLHLRIPRSSPPGSHCSFLRLHSLLLILGALSIVMTYLGVSCLPSLHSYL